MTSKLAQMQAKFQQKQMQEKEEKLLKLYENQQQRTIERVSRGSAGSDGVITTTTTTTTTNLMRIPGGKVRQMFDERRQKAGIDRSYPLEPIKARANSLSKVASEKNKNGTTKTVVRSTVQTNVKSIRSGKPTLNRQEIIKSVYTNENGNESYKEEHRNENNTSNNNDVIRLMNNHNISDNLDDEVMPNLGLDKEDEPIFTGRLANVGGKLPSQNELNKKLEHKLYTSALNEKITIPPKKKTTSKPQQLSPKRTSITTSRSPNQSETPAKISPTSPAKINMSAKKQHQDRVPSTNRPSARQAPRAPASAVTRDDFASCRFCNRRFAPDRLQVHEEICSKTGKKKRKVYDALKHRVQGTELEPFSRKTAKTPSKPSRTASAKKNNWRQTHDEFISTIRAAKLAQAHLAKGGKLSDLPPPPPSSNPDYVQCPHCGRKFNEAAAARHIPKCATYDFNKPKAQPSKQGQKASSRASYK